MTGVVPGGNLVQLVSRQPYPAGGGERFHQS